MRSEITGESVGKVRVVSDMHQRRAEMACLARLLLSLHNSNM